MSLISDARLPIRAQSVALAIPRLANATKMADRHTDLAAVNGSLLYLAALMQCAEKVRQGSY